MLLQVGLQQPKALQGELSGFFGELCRLTHAPRLRQIPCKLLRQTIRKVTPNNSESDREQPAVLENGLRDKRGRASMVHRWCASLRQPKQPGQMSRFKLTGVKPCAIYLRTMLAWPRDSWTLAMAVFADLVASLVGIRRLTWEEAFELSIARAKPR
jgi:hypothetical protein